MLISVSVQRYGNRMWLHVAFGARRSTARAKARFGVAPPADAPARRRDHGQPSGIGGEGENTGIESRG